MLSRTLKTTYLFVWLSQPPPGCDHQVRAVRTRYERNAAVQQVNFLFPYYLPIFLSWPSPPCCEVRNQGYHTSPLRLDNVARQYPLLSCILLLVPRRIWPFVMAVALLVFGVYDLRLGLSLRTVFQLPDAIETLTPHMVSGMLLVRSWGWVRRRRRSRSLHHVPLYKDSTDWPRYI